MSTPIELTVIEATPLVINGETASTDLSTLPIDASPELTDYAVTINNGVANKTTWQKIKDLFGAAAGAWGSITGTLSNQTDLQSALDAKQDEATVVSSNQTAVNDGVYVVVASATFTDPSPSEGKGFTVFVRNGTATVGGTAYATAGTVIRRIYHSGAWANYADVPGGGTLPAGTVVQVLTAVAGPTIQTINSITPVTITGLSITITPQSASNLIVIFASFPFIHDYQTISSFGVFKDGVATVSTSGNGNENNMQFTFYATPLQNYDSIQGQLMHSELAGTTSATTYTIRATNGWAGTPGNLYINGRPNADMSGFSYFTIFEIKQ